MPLLQLRGREGVQYELAEYLWILAEMEKPRFSKLYTAETTRNERFQLATVEL